MVQRWFGHLHAAKVVRGAVEHVCPPAGIDERIEGNPGRLQRVLLHLFQQAYRPLALVSHPARPHQDREGHRIRLQPALPERIEGLPSTIERAIPHTAVDEHRIADGVEGGAVAVEGIEDAKGLSSAYEGFASAREAWRGAAEKQ